MADDNQNNGANNAAEAYQNLLKKMGDDANAVALKLFGENYDYRQKISELKAKVPAENSVILSTDDAKTWNEFKQFLTDKQTDFEKVKEAFEQNPVLQTENKKLIRRDSFREAEVLGNRLDVLEAGLEPFPDAVLTIKKMKNEKDPTKEVKVPYVSLDGKESSLKDFEKEHFPKHLASLEASNEVQRTNPPGNLPSPQVYGGQGDLAADKVARDAQARSTMSGF